MSHSPKSTSSADLADSYANTTLDSSTHIDNHTDAYSETYFDALYNDNTDPWEYQTRWYEKRKRDICLAILPQAEYNNAIELGSGNGVFSELLTQRCQTLTCVDGNH
ncbi:SAM-dependent methyltransferase, partial [Psychrobacter sp. 1U2]